MGQARSRQAGEIDAHVGRALRKLRQERGLSLRDLALAMGHTSGQAVSKYEHGAAFPAALMFVTAEALGVPVSTFFQGLPGAAPGVAEDSAPFLAEDLADSTESRKIVALLRSAPARQHGMILRVVRAMTAGAEPGSGPEPRSEPEPEPEPEPGSSGG